MHYCVVIFTLQNFRWTLLSVCHVYVSLCHMRHTHTHRHAQTRSSRELCNSVATDSYNCIHACRRQNETKRKQKKWKSNNTQLDISSSYAIHHRVMCVHFLFIRVTCNSFQFRPLCVHSSANYNSVLMRCPNIRRINIFAPHRRWRRQRLGVR